MPPLSAYTPFESLLFFQSLAALDTRPTSFVSISDLLRNNQFVRDNVAFDAHRLSPEALEELYTTLMRDGLDSTGAPPSLEQNGNHVDPAPSSNPKKRKITSPRPEGLSDKVVGHVSFVPGLVTHLYAKYKELVTKEIKNEEKRFKEIRDEIEQLQKEEREAPAVPAPEPALAPISKEKQESAPEPMDIDTEEVSPVQIRPPKEQTQAPSEPMIGVEAAQPQVEPPRKDLDSGKQQPVQPAPPVRQPNQPETQLPTPQSLTQPQKAQAKKPQARQVQTQEQPRQVLQPLQTPQSEPIQARHPQEQPQPPVSGTPQQSHLATPGQPQSANGKVLSTPQMATAPAQSAPLVAGPMKVPPVQPQKLPPVAASGASPTKTPVGTPLQASQPSTVPAPPIPQKPAQPVKAPGKKGSSAAAPAPEPQRLPPQSSFQQWSLKEPQTPQPPPSRPALESSIHPKPTPKPATVQVSKKESNAQQGTQPAVAPATPGPALVSLQSPAPSGIASGFETPLGPAKPLPFTVPRGARPRLSIATPGSSTPWKQTPHLAFPRSPRSPERPRPEDVSPISEKAPSPFRSREATPEEPEPRRRKRRAEGKGTVRGREKGDGESKVGRPKKGEKASGPTSKKRDRSTASSRSRGRSVASRDEESATESAAQAKIKREVPSTPAGVLESTEPERISTGRKGTAVGEEPRGRGRPKRKRPPSEAPEPESQPEISQLNRIDPNQSASFVLCTRNFPRTGAPIMNDVTTHKHASIFTKPLTERDAPGYRGLIYRPQDLKSIKSSIYQGSKALNAATEAASTPVADGESPAPTKNAVLMLQKTEDVIPPKGIVNSAQLEKELIRMFANAVMFNPVPQRGFGPAFPMVGDDGSRGRAHAPEPDEGGIIKDTLEMFEDVEQAVTRWRAAERTADELASKSILSLRRESASDPNTDSADDVKG